MGKKSKFKTDKFSLRARVAGYRARSAYKLIQLNTKFNFLQNARVCIDLCAAPGSWTQVAARFMPMSSVIIAVDLYPIRPIPNTITIQGDITTPVLAHRLEENLKTWKADVILHDGSPNVGTSWLQDAYHQNVLVLHSFKLACKFLKKGGTFLTKVFRSKDHYCLDFIFRKLFSKVQTTKPIASRLESAEIYVICQGFLAPDKIDTNFFDPKHVFHSLEAEPKNKINIMKPVSKKPKAEGYEEGVSMLHKTKKISEFIYSPQYIDVLENANDFLWDLPKARESVHTTYEILELFKDIKVLNRKDLRALLNWRKTVKEELGPLKEDDEEKSLKSEEPEEKEDVKLEDDDELTQDLEEIEKIQKEVDELKASSLRERKRHVKKIEKQKKKLSEKNSMRLMVPGDPGPQESSRSNLFSLRTLNDVGDVDTVIDENADMPLSSESEDDTDSFVPKRISYSKRGIFNEETGTYDKPYEDPFEMGSGEDSDDEDIDSTKENVKERRESITSNGASSATLSSILKRQKKEEGSDLENDPEEEPDLKKSKKKSVSFSDNPLITDLIALPNCSKDELKAETWFNKAPIFDTLEKEDIEDYEMDKFISNFRWAGLRLATKRGGEGDLLKPWLDHQKRLAQLEDAPPEKGEELKAANWLKPLLDHQKGLVKKEEGEKDELDSDTESESDPEISPPDPPDEEPPAKKKKVRLDDEGLALATKMIHSKKMKREIYESGFNRYMRGNEKLPDWFEKDEIMHNRPRIEVDKEDLKLYRKVNKAVDAKTLKKVVEAKARKQRRLKKAMAKTRKRAELISNNRDMTQREKAVEIKKIYSKMNFSVNKKKDVKYIVMKKQFQGRKPKGTKGKGPTRMVDPRMKKDKRAKKAKETKKKGKRKRR